MMSNERVLKIIAEEKRKQTGRLDLSHMRLDAIPEEILGLGHLESLSLRSNQISDIRFLESLTGLQTLDLSHNGISDIRFLENLISLQSLNLGYNGISDIRFLENLISLQFLYLSGNQISDIFPLKPLKKLKSISLAGNYITKLPSWILDFNLNILYNGNMYSNKLYIGHNPLESPPIEIARKGHNAIVQYFEDLEQQGKDYLYEAKLLIVGDGGGRQNQFGTKDGKTR